MTPWAQAADNWQLADAPLRYKLDLLRKPSHKSAGYFISLPDGGLLRGNKAATTVLTEDGKVLASYLLWQNVENGFALVFAKPEAEAKSVYVYIQPGAPAKVWNPATGLTPGTILCTLPGRDAIAASQILANFGRVEAGVHWGENPGHPAAALSIGGDLSERPKPAAFYQLSHLDAPVAGEYWIAPFIHTGQGEVRVDGQKIEPKEKSKKWGGTGAALKLSKGLHRVEVLQTAPASGPNANPRDGLMYLTWRTPNEEIKNWEARSIKASEVARSGACSLVAVESRDGAPLAAAKTTPGLTYWFGNEEPLIIFEFNALNKGYPADAKVSWTFPEGATIEGTRVKWLVPGFRDGKVKMTVKSGQSVSSSIVPYFGFSTEKTTLENALHREAFRDTLAEMLAVFPKNPDPVTTWGDAWWNNIFRTVEGGEGENLLSRLFTDHFAAMRKRLAPAQMCILEDVFMDVTLRDHPEETIQWLKKFFLGTSDIARQNDLRFREGELHMYYLNDRNNAEKLFTTLSAGRGEVAERAKIRLGDLALLAGDLNKATKFYADVQNRARTVRNATSIPTGAMVSKQLLTAGSGASTMLSPKAAPDMKGGALQEVSLSENVRTLASGGFLLEARQTLDAWETEFPLSKISGDFILREGAIYTKMNDWKRARPMLEAYCREIDASSYLPDAVSTLILCVQASKADPASIRGIVEKVRDRLKFHPIASQLDKFLSTAGPAPK
ncbi:MAG: hypothetical protein DVB28_000093 [Verrucomicrobia bacterium]|nr:MAG: hypothetical protein DVB28_000093 [Verrucomicrobiota bacterium]